MKTPSFQRFLDQFYRKLPTLMIKSLSKRPCFTLILAILSLFAFNATVLAQDGGGNRMKERLGGMDENHNGVLEPNEWQNSPMRGFVERVGGDSHLDLSKPVSIEKMAESMSEMRGRGGFGGGGFGGFGDRGGFGGRGDRGGFGGEGRGGWGGRGEGRGWGGEGGWGGGRGGEGRGWGGRGEWGGRGGNDNNGRDGNREGRDRDGRDRDSRNDNRDGRDKSDSKDGKNDKDKSATKSVNSNVLGFSDPGNVVSTPVLGFSDPNSANLAAKSGEGSPDGGRSENNPNNSSGGPNITGGDESERRGRVREMARAKIVQYDENKDGVLQKNEWEKISGDPKRADANNDELITLDEYSNRLWEKSSNGGQENWNGGGNFGGNRGGFAGRSNIGNDASKAKRYLSATERLPEGMPSWFIPADLNGDGQVTMAEYSNNWSDSRMAEFRRIDKNNDGIITSQECVMTPLARPSYASSESNGGDYDDGDGYGPEAFNDGPSSNSSSDQGRGPRRDGRGDFSRGEGNKSSEGNKGGDSSGGPSFGGSSGNSGRGPGGFGGRGGFDRNNFGGGNNGGNFNGAGGFDRSRFEGGKGGGPGGNWQGFSRRGRGGDANRDGGSRDGNRDGKSNN
jgi:hypothetical protein